MKAWRMYGIGDMRLDEIPIPEVKPGHVLIKVKVLQPSVTEVQQAQGKTVASGTDFAAIVKEKGPLQLFGHEFCGEVVEKGDGVDDKIIGARVFHTRRVPCHQCALCRSGYEEYCQNITSWVGGQDLPGCLAEYIALSVDDIAIIPDSITDSEAAAMQPLVGAVGDVFNARIELGDVVVILGQGVMGLNCMQTSRSSGAGKIIAVDLRDEALKLSAKLGADIVIDARKQDPLQAVQEITKGAGADVVFECAGGSPDQGLSGAKTIQQAISLVREAGRIVQVAHLGHDVMVPGFKIANRHLHYIGFRFATKKLIDYAINLVASKRVQLAPYVTHVLHGLDKVPEAFEKTGNKAKYGGINPAQVIVTSTKKG